MGVSQSRSLTAIAAIGSLLFLCVGCGPPTELTREKALELLQTAGPELLPDAQWSDALYDFNVQAGKLNCLTHKRIVFSEHLETAGIITRTVRDYPQLNEFRPGGTSYKFQIAESTYAIARPYSAINFVMGKPQLVEITGIRQEGSSAIAEARVDFVSTPIYQALLATEAQLAQEDSGQGCGRLYSLPDSEGLAFRFERYDDGWRMLGKTSREVVPQPPEEVAQSSSISLSPATQPSLSAAVGGATAWEVPSLGNYSDGSHQLELWRDSNARGRVIGLLKVFPADVSQSPVIGELAEVVGNGEQGTFRFTARLSSGEVKFDGVMRDGVLSGEIRCAFAPEARQTTFNRLDRQYEANYATRDAWQHETAELLSCCGPGAAAQ